MADRIDHAMLARKFSGGDRPLEDGSFDQTRDYLLAAQVHATLALVEQQRIANLIAALGIEEAAGNTRFAAQVWNNHIREGLGL